MKKLFIAILIIIILGIAWYLGSPLFLNKTVEEALPFTMSSKDDGSDTVIKPSYLPVPTTPTYEPPNQPALYPPVVLPTPAQPIVEEPMLYAQGQFQNGDDFHKGSGTIKIFKMTEGALLRLENFDVTNGPDLFVYLTKNPAPDSSAKVKEGFYNAGRLKGNRGNQNYEIPADVNLNDYKGVVIYCRAFSVLFSFSPLN